jgi:DNA-binding transcriptional regulator YiaG
MGTQTKQKRLAEWAQEITALRARLGMSQGEFANGWSVLR